MKKIAMALFSILSILSFSDTTTTQNANNEELKKQIEKNTEQIKEINENVRRGKGNNAYILGDIAAEAKSDFSVAIGSDAVVETDSLAGASIGYFSKASGLGSVALGTMSNALGAFNVALGATATIEKTEARRAESSIAIGIAKIKGGDSSIAMGTGSVIEDTNFAVAIGAGSNISELKREDGFRAVIKDTSKGKKYINYKDGKFIVRETESSKEELVKENGEAYAAVAIGIRASAHNIGGVALGMYSTSIGDSSTAVGKGAKTLIDEATSLGGETIVHAKRGTALGYLAKAKEEGSVALGSSSEATTKAGIIGKMPEEKFDETNVDKLYEYVATDLKYDDIKTEQDYTNLDNSIKEKNEEKRKIEAKISDAENKKDEALLNEAKLELEKWETDNQKLDENIKKRNEIIAKVVTWKSTDGAISIGVDGSRSRQLTNLAAGTKATDAVNLAQLESVMNLPVKFYKNNEEKAETKLSKMNFEIGDGLSVEKKDNGRILIGLDSKALDNNKSIVKIKGDIADTGAMSAALSGLKALDYDPLRPSQFTAAMGAYKGKAAIALGLNHYTSENTMINGALSFNFSNAKNVMFNIGFTHKFGNRKEIEKLPKKYQAGPISSIYAMQEEIQKLNKEKNELERKVDKLEKMLEKILKIEVK